MKTRILTVLFLSLCYVCGAINVDAQPRAPKIYYNTIQTPPPPPPGRPGKRVHPPKTFNPIGHIYGFSIPGHKIMFNFCTNGRVYREGDNIGCPFTVYGNVITVYNNYGPQRIIATGKISHDGRIIEWKDFSNGSIYHLRVIG